MSYIYDMAQTWNDAGQTFYGIKLNITNTASAAASKLMDLLLAGSSKFNVDLSGSVTIGGDVTLARDGADTLAFRRSTNAQSLRIYNTYTDASNYERLLIGWGGDALLIYNQNAGTGSARAMAIGTVGAAALSFVTTNTERWQVNSSGHLMAGTDNTYDIGASAATRPRNIYAAGTVFAGSGQWTGTNLQTAASSLVLKNSTGSDAPLVVFGGATSSFPALKRSTTLLQSRLADDSDFAPLQGRLRVHANAAAETPSATHTLRVFDAAGTEYKVLAVAA